MGELGNPREGKEGAMDGEMEAAVTQFKGFTLQEAVFVTGMQGEHVIHAFYPETNEVEVLPALGADDDERKIVSVDRLVKK